jgi:hypothetical protein
MPHPTTTFKLLLISPGDVLEERQAVVNAVERWNATTGLNLAAHVVTTRWEFARPDMSGPAQDIINQQLVDEADFGVAIFWARLGSPTEKHRSGSAEEVERLIGRGANVMVYFSSKPVPQELLKDDQYGRLQELRADYQKRGLLAFFPSPDNLAELVSLHLTSLVSALLTKERAGNQPIPSVGSMTAPKPDVRVIVSSGLVGQDKMFPRLIVEVQNHSPVDFFFSGLRFSQESGKQLAIMREAAYGLPLMPEKIEPGNGKSIVIDLAEMMSAMSAGDRVTNAFIVDKIDRRYFADPKQTEAAIASTMKQLENDKRPPRT